MKCLNVICTFWHNATFYIIIYADKVYSILIYFKSLEIQERLLKSQFSVNSIIMKYKPVTDAALHCRHEDSD